MMLLIAPSSVSKILPTPVIDLPAPPTLRGRKLQARKFAAPAVKRGLAEEIAIAPPFIPASFVIRQNRRRGRLRTAGSTRP
jgi:hypothetical protein